MRSVFHTAIQLWLQNEWLKWDLKKSTNHITIKKWKKKNLTETTKLYHMPSFNYHITHPNSLGSLLRMQCLLNRANCLGFHKTETKIIIKRIFFDKYELPEIVKHHNTIFLTFSICGNWARIIRRATKVSLKVRFSPAFAQLLRKY